MVGQKKDRRRTRGFNLAKSVLCNQANRLAPAKTADIGSGGIRLISELPLKKGDTFEFLVVLEGTGLKFVGTVVHAAPMSDGRMLAGISFDESSGLSVSVLEDYLESHVGSYSSADETLSPDPYPN
jgi:hypothetical protein